MKTLLSGFSIIFRIKAKQNFCPFINTFVEYSLYETIALEVAMEPDNLLDHLKDAIDLPQSSRKDILSAIKDVLEWLDELPNNTDANCRKVDYFIASEIIGKPRYHEMPEDIQGLLFDMGSALSDTFSAPDIADNFESTPTQLLTRVRQLLDTTLTLF